MSTEVSKKLQELLKPTFKSEGFKKKGRSWGCVTDEIAKLFNIQCSQNSERIYLNIGIYIQAAGIVDFPSEVNCHIRFRLEQILDSKEEILAFYDLTDFENCNDVVSRVNQISELVKNKVIPWFRSINSLIDIVTSPKVKSTMYWNNGKKMLEQLCKNHITKPSI